MKDGSSDAISEVRDHYAYSGTKGALIEHYAHEAVGHAWTKSQFAGDGNIISFERVKNSRPYKLEVKYNEQNKTAFDIVLSVRTPSNC